MLLVIDVRPPVPDTVGNVGAIPEPFDVHTWPAVPVVMATGWPDEANEIRLLAVHVASLANVTLLSKIFGVVTALAAIFALLTIPFEIVITPLMLINASPVI